MTEGRCILKEGNWLWNKWCGQSGELGVPIPKAQNGCVVDLMPSNSPSMAQLLDPGGS